MCSSSECSNRCTASCKSDGTSVAVRKFICSSASERDSLANCVNSDNNIWSPSSSVDVAADVADEVVAAGATGAAAAAAATAAVVTVCALKGALM